MKRFIFITGGVVSSLGKGIASAALGALLQSRGYRVRLRKLDPYLNVDPGTTSPTHHGEVFVTDADAETSATTNGSPASPRARPTTPPPAASTRRSSKRNAAVTISARRSKSFRT